MNETHRHIPASHAAAALGFVDWSTPLATYLSVTQAKSWDENPEEPQRGVRLVAALRGWASGIVEREFHPPRSPFYAGSSHGARAACLSARPHGQTASGDAALLLKTPTDLSRWYAPFDEDTDDASAEKVLLIPTDVQVEAAVTNCLLRPETLYVGVLVGGDLRMLRYVGSADFESKVLAVVSSFWKRHVEAGKMPSATKPADEKTLRTLFPKATRELPLAFGALSLPHREAVLQWAQTQRTRTAAQKVEKELRPLVVEAITDYPGLCDFPAESGVRSVTFEEREPHANNGTWKAIAGELLAKLSPRAQKRLMEKHTPTVGTRVLRPFFTGGKAS